MGERGCLKITKFECTYFMDGLLGYSKENTHTLKKTQAYTKSMNIEIQKQPSRVVLKIRCSENIQQVYWRTPVSECDLQSNFIKITLGHGCSPVNLLRIFRTSFLWTPPDGCIWAFGYLVHYIRYLQEVLVKYLKNKVVSSETPFFVSFILYFSIVVLST